MRKKQLDFFYNNKILADDINDFRLEVFNQLIKELEGIKVDRKKISFYCREVNSPYNISIIKEQYEYLRNVFSLKPFGRLPKKICTSVLIKISKILGFSIINTRRYLRIDNKISTQGFYMIDYSNACLS